MRRIMGGLLVATLATTGGCRPRPQLAADRKPVVAVSVAPQAWLVREVAGDLVEVVTMVGPTENHETYQPTDAQISRLMQAAVYFRIGVSFENGPWFEAIRSSGRLRVVDLRRGISLRPIDATHDHPATQRGAAQGVSHDPDGESACGDSGWDPHIWLSPRLLRIQAQTVADVLGELAPADKAAFDRNLEQLEAKLQELDELLRRKLAPLGGRPFFVFHPAWGYFADDYGLRQVAVEVEGKEPSDYELTRLQQQARQSGAKVVFVQPQVNGRAARAVADAVGGRVEVVDPMPPDVPAALVHMADALVESYSGK